MLTRQLSACAGDASYGAALLAKAGYQKTADKQTVSQAAELKH